MRSRVNGTLPLAISNTVECSTTTWLLNLTSRHAAYMPHICCRAAGDMAKFTLLNTDCPASVSTLNQMLTSHEALCASLYLGQSWNCVSHKQQMVTDGPSVSDRMFRWAEAVMMLLLGLLSAIVHIPVIESFLSEYQLTWSDTSWYWEQWGHEAVRMNPENPVEVRHSWDDQRCSLQHCSCRKLEECSLFRGVRYESISGCFRLTQPYWVYVYVCGGSYHLPPLSPSLLLSPTSPLPRL